MTDPPVHSDAGTPRWVKVVGVVGLVVAVLILVLILTGRGGSHGPGRHTAPLTAAAQGGQQP